MDINIKGFSLQQFAQVMDVLQVKHKTVASNIANTNTPGYVRQTVDFKHELEKVISEGDGNITSPINGSSKASYSPVVYQEVEVTEDLSTPGRTDGNNVNLESEMVELAQNGQVFQTLAKAASGYFKTASFVIRGGR